jgi:hypothetical protein
MTTAAETDIPAMDTQEARSTVARLLVRMFQNWNLPTRDSLALMGLAESNRAALLRYEQGLPLANSRDQLDRAATLLGIHKSLRLLFPENRDLAYRWMSTPNRAFEGRTPVETVRQHGFAGLLMVRAYLDRARGR